VRPERSCRSLIRPGRLLKRQRENVSYSSEKVGAEVHRPIVGDDLLTKNFNIVLVDEDRSVRWRSTPRSNPPNMPEPLPIDRNPLIDPGSASRIMEKVRIVSIGSSEMENVDSPGRERLRCGPVRFTADSEHVFRRMRM